MGGVCTRVEGGMGKVLKIPAPATATRALVPCSTSPVWIGTCRAQHPLQTEPRQCPKAGTRKELSSWSRERHGQGGWGYHWLHREVTLGSSRDRLPLWWDVRNVLRVCIPTHLNVAATVEADRRASEDIPEKPLASAVPRLRNTVPAPKVRLGSETRAWERNSRRRASHKGKMRGRRRTRRNRCRQFCNTHPRLQIL